MHVMLALAGEHGMFPQWEPVNILVNLVCKTYLSIGVDGSCCGFDSG
jgi:hypothetical protein